MLVYLRQNTLQFDDDLKKNICRSNNIHCKQFSTDLTLWYETFQTA